MSGIHVASVIPTMALAAGGPTFCVSALCENCALTGIKSSLFTVRAPNGESEHLPNPALVTAVAIPGYHFESLRLSWSPSFKSTLRHSCRERRIDVLHSHEIWTQPNHAAVVVARELGLPLVISPHGMLEPWAWRHHAWKKRPAWWLWQRRDLNSAAVLHATAPQEVDALRGLGLRNPIALIPNGVDLPKDAGPKPVNGSRMTSIPCLQAAAEGLASRKRNALFISRIHPKKGLLNLVAAWSQIRPAGWSMVVSGPDECEHTEQVKQAVVAAGLSEEFDFIPPAYGPAKEELYANADLFVLPTFSENFGIVIAEALAAGVPVITTKGTPWEELRARQCGWWIDIGVEPLAAALREAVSLSDQQRREMGRKGRCLVEERYAWPQIGREMKAVYKWLTGSGPRPPCIV
jgi:glycosyltransferase involved in cell wall biosynthesis